MNDDRYCQYNSLPWEMQSGKVNKIEDRELEINAKKAENLLEQGLTTISNPFIMKLKLDHPICK